MKPVRFESQKFDLMTTKKRICELEEKASTKNERLFILLTCLSDDPGELCVTGGSQTPINFRDRASFEPWAREDGMSKEEIEQMCEKLSWNRKQNGLSVKTK
jgi:hypothetical protein